MCIGVRHSLSSSQTFRVCSEGNSGWGLSLRIPHKWYTPSRSYWLFPVMSGPFMECGGPWALASPTAVEQADGSPTNPGEFLSMGQMLTNKKVAGKSLLPPCSPNWNVQRCVGFVKPEWRCALLHEQLAVSPPVSAVSSVINACVLLPPFLSLFCFSLLLLLMDCVPAVAGKLCLWLCFLGILH